MHDANGRNCTEIFFEIEKCVNRSIMDGISSKIYHLLNDKTKKSDNFIAVSKHEFKLWALERWHIRIRNLSVKKFVQQLIEFMKNESINKSEAENVGISKSIMRWVTKNDNKWTISIYFKCTSGISNLFVLMNTVRACLHCDKQQTGANRANRGLIHTCSFLQCLLLFGCHVKFRELIGYLL